MTELEFVTKLNSCGARVFIVGGWVRDKIRGVAAHDKDYMVTGITEAAFLNCLPEAHKVGKAFPVYLVNVDDNMVEVAFARKEKKIGAGYHGFSVEYDASVTLEEDLYRRDTTMNSLALELPQNTLYDFFNGAKVIENKQIVAISEHFCDDPVRALRAARQAAEFNFSISDETYCYMTKCRDELRSEPQERLFNELKRALAAPKPSIYFKALARAELLEVVYPEIYALIGKTQPIEYHPEGDAFNHTMEVVDKVAAQTDSLLARFCGLAHDLGKGTTPKAMEPHHYGHELRGDAVIMAWNRRMTIPHEWLSAARLVIREHMRAPRLNKVAKIARLLLSLNKSCLTVAEFNAVIMADHHSLPVYLTNAEALIAAMQKVDGHAAPSKLIGKKIGEWVWEQQIKICHAFLRKLTNG